MFRGQMIALASPDRLRDELPGALVQMDCDHPNQVKAVLEELPGVIEASVHGALMHVTLESLDRQAEVEQALAQAGIRVNQIEAIQPSLEDVFIYMVDKSRADASEAQKAVQGA
jgi:ABC-2 type transport system ATP-binding protein